MRRVIEAGFRWGAAGWLLAMLALGPVSRATVFKLPADGGSLIGKNSMVQSATSATLLGKGTTIVIPGRFIVPPAAAPGAERRDGTSGLSGPRRAAREIAGTT